MNMLLLFVLCAGLFAKCSLADEENEVKRGAFPFMAFVYYSDKTIVDRTGSRLTRGAVLIRPDWLISSSLEDGDTPLAFPKKTLLARLGAIRIDPKFSFNEDEEEQEREIVQMASSFTYKASEWWVADITLLKTLLPFNISRMVEPVQINANIKTDKSCFILVYSAQNGNKSDDRLLMKFSVEMLPATLESCGRNFIKSSMICAADGDDMKKESNFCEGNSGSPLICDNNVVGIQSYISDCKPPYLFQNLRSWDNLITCAVEDKCHEEQCGTICNVINKDPIEPSPQQVIAEARQYPEENVNRTDDGNVQPSMSRRLSPDGSKSISEDDADKGVQNTETTTTVSATVVYASETEKMSEFVTVRTEEEEKRDKSFAATPSVNTETETTHYTYKTEELVSKVEELRNLIGENSSTDKSEIKEEEPKEKQLEPSTASVNTRCPCCLMFASLILFYLQFSFIVNSC